jgi:hypothetical protein
MQPSVRSSFAPLNGILHIGSCRRNKIPKFGQIYSRVDDCQVGARTPRVLFSNTAGKIPSTYLL